MKHSVVIPLYNKESYIFETLKSLAMQTKKPYELIIVDDRSTDNSLVCLKDALSFFSEPFAEVNIRLVELQKNEGPGYARNVGLDLATGDIVSFLDADDCYTPTCLHEIAEVMEKHNIEVLVLGIQWVPSRTYLPEVTSFLIEMELIAEDLFLITNPLHTASAPDFIMGVGSNVAVATKRLKGLRYDTSVSLNEGIDFWYRVLKNCAHQARVGLLNKICIEVREVEGSLSRSNYRHWTEVKVPLSIQRYVGSHDHCDQQLMGMLAERWHKHAMERLPTLIQKLLFMLNHARILWRNRSYRERRRTTNGPNEGREFGSGKYARP